MLRIRIRFLRIRILEFFPDPDPGQKHIFLKGNNKILGDIFVFNQKSRYFIERELLFGII